MNPETTVIDFAHFARVRNAWLRLREDEDYYFSVDADVVLQQSFALSQLIDRNLDIVAVPVNNAENRLDGYSPEKETIIKILQSGTPEQRAFASAALRGEIKNVRFGDREIWNFGMMNNGRMIRFKRQRGLMEVDITGACILFSSKVIEDGVEYGPASIGEDLYFCTLAKSKGYNIFVDGTLDTIHMMDYNPITKEGIE